MKRVKFLAVGLFVCAAAVVGYKSYGNATESAQRQLMLQNVEVLAKTEPSDKKECWDTVTTSDSQQTRYCGTCEFVPGKPSTWAGKSEC